MASYYSVRLGSGAAHLEEAVMGGWIGVGWMANIDLTSLLTDKNEDFRKKFNETVMSTDGLKTKIAAGLATSATWVVCKQMELGDVVLSPTSGGDYRIGRITGDYYFAPGAPLPHRRPVQWENKVISKGDISSQLRGSIAVNGTLVWLNGYPDEVQAAYEQEIEQMFGSQASDGRAASLLDENVSFVMEKYLEAFLVANWSKTELGKSWDLVGSQVMTETGPLDILAQSKDGKTLLVVELKLKKATDDVLGQIQRYMGWVKSQAEPGQDVRGLIIGLEKDTKLRWALDVASNVSFMKYELDFRLTSN